MAISVNDPQLFYQCFYLLAFIVMFSIVIYRGIKLGYSLRSLLFTLAIITLFTVIGTKLITIPIDRWIDALSLDHSTYTNRSSLGGVLFGLLGFMVSVAIFRFKRPILNLFAWVAPIGLAFTKLGCLFNGCCYGLAFNGLWSVTYPVTTNAHYSHWFSGAIENDAIQSLALHPVQLYESLLLLGIAFIVWKTQNLWKQNLSAILFTLCLYFTFRFGIEFFRDHSGSQLSNIYYFKVWSLQWVMLGIGLVMGICLWFNESRVKGGLSIKQTAWLNHRNAELLCVVLLSTLIYGFQNLLQPFEILAIWMIFIPASMLFLYSIFNDEKLKNRRKRVIMVMLLSPLYVMAHTVSNDTLQISKYKRIDIGASFGNFTNELNFDPQSNDCGGTSYSTEYFKQVYQIAGAGIAQVNKQNNRINTFGANITAGNIKSENLSTNESESEFVYSFNPYYKWDSKWFGYGVGFHFGNLRLNKEPIIKAENLNDANKEYTFLPEVQVRVLPKKYVSLQHSYGFLTPAAYPTLNWRSSIGSSFGLGDDYDFRIGKVWKHEYTFISAEGLITENLGVSLMYVFDNDEFSYVENNDTSGKFLFSLNYRFGHKIK